MQKRQQYIHVYIRSHHFYKNILTCDIFKDILSQILEKCIILRNFNVKYRKDIYRVWKDAKSIILYTTLYKYIVYSIYICICRCEKHCCLYITEAIRKHYQNSKAQLTS